MNIHIRTTMLQPVTVSPRAATFSGTDGGRPGWGVYFGTRLPPRCVGSRRRSRFRFQPVRYGYAGYLARMSEQSHSHFERLPPLQNDVNVNIGEIYRNIHRI
jgi:hypothetical protein